MKKCLNCDNPIKRNAKKFCSLSCNGNYTEKQSIKKWLSGKISGHTGKVKNIKPFVKSHLFEKYKNSCTKCGWNIPHPISGIPPLEANHIDGNSDNTIDNNLELLCPNCHSLTPNFKNRNKGNGRLTRRIGAGRRS